MVLIFLQNIINAGISCARYALVFLMNYRDFIGILRQFVAERRRAVFGTIVNHQDFDAFIFLLQNRVHCFFQVIFAVIYRNNYMYVKISHAVSPADHKPENAFSGSSNYTFAFLFVMIDSNSPAGTHKTVRNL